MHLIEGLRIKDDKVVAFVGAGGKSTALFLAARELLSYKYSTAEKEKTILVTSTTHLATWQARLADHYYKVSSQSDIDNIFHNLPSGVVLITGGEVHDRLAGLSVEQLEKVRLIAEKNRFPLLIEADGSGGRPLKAPAMHEPAIPEFAKTIVVVAGLMGIGKSLSEKWVHRPEIFAELTGMKMGEDIPIEALTKMLLHPNGGQKNIPTGCRKIVLLNQADNYSLRASGRFIANRLLPKYDSIILASLQKDKESLPVGSVESDVEQNKIHAVVEPIAGIVLAAGGSSRYGSPKQLLSWNGEPFIRHILRSAIESGLSPIIVVLGHSGGAIKAILSDLPVHIVNNKRWASGLSSSIREGINGISTQVGGAVFLQADQPQTSSTLIRKIIEAHQINLAPITAPLIDNQRGNPILFDRNTFNELLSLKGDVGGKVLFSRYPIQWVPWHDSNQKIDVDTPEDYQKFLDLFEGKR